MEEWSRNFNLFYRTVCYFSVSLCCCKFCLRIQEYTKVSAGYFSVGGPETRISGFVGQYSRRFWKHFTQWPKSDSLLRQVCHSLRFLTLSAKVPIYAAQGNSLQCGGETSNANRTMRLPLPKLRSKMPRRIYIYMSINILNWRVKPISCEIYVPCLSESGKDILHKFRVCLWHAFTGHTTVPRPRTVYRFNSQTLSTSLTPFKSISLFSTCRTHTRAFSRLIQRFSTRDPLAFFFLRPANISCSSVRWVTTF